LILTDVRTGQERKSMFWIIKKNCRYSWQWCSCQLVCFNTKEQSGFVYWKRHQVGIYFILFLIYWLWIFIEISGIMVVVGYFFYGWIQLKKIKRTWRIFHGFLHGFPTFGWEKWFYLEKAGSINYDCIRAHL
jgi:hypothetical protein